MYSYLLRVPLLHQIALTQIIQKFNNPLGVKNKSPETQQYQGLLKLRIRANNIFDNSSKTL